MNFLAIYPYLPLPELDADENDFLFDYYERYAESYHNVSVVYLKPQMYAPWLARLSSRWRGIQQAVQQKTLWHRGAEVLVWPYITLRRSRRLHALLSHSILFNKNEIADFTRERKIDVVHAQHIYPDGLLALFLFKRSKIPFILTIRNHEERFLARPNAVTKTILRHASGITCFSNSTGSLLSDLGFPSELLPHGVDDVFFKTGISERPTNAGLRLLSVARLLRKKNLQQVIDALAGLKNELVFQYTIVGQGPELAALKRQAARLGIEEHIKFVPGLSRAALAQIMAEHDVFVLPSQDEVLGRVYLEAMAVGLPVIYSAGTGIDGLVTESQAGLRVTPGKLDELVAAIRRFGDNSFRKAVSERAKKTGRRFAWEKVLATSHKLYSEAGGEWR